MNKLQIAFMTTNEIPLFHNDICFCVIKREHVSEIITAIKKDVASHNIEDKINAMFLWAKIKREGIIVLC